MEPHERMRRAARMDLLAAVAPAVQHEVNNALMVLASNLDLLGRSAPEEGPARRQLDRAAEAARRLDATVRGYLDVARRGALDQVAMPLEVVLAQLSPLLRVVLGARLRLEVAVPGGSAPVSLDRARLDTALIAAAREASAMKTPGGTLVLAAAASDGGMALTLRLPDGCVPSPALLGLLAEAAEAAGGRSTATEGGAVLHLRAA